MTSSAMIRRHFLGTLAIASAFIVIVWYSLVYLQFISSSDSSNRNEKHMSPLSWLSGGVKRANAVIVVLCRNYEVEDLRESLAQFEHVFNAKHHYPYVFLNDQPFDAEFRKSMEKLLVGRYHPDHLPKTRNVSFGLIPKEHWSYPDWIDKKSARKRMAWMASHDVMYGGSESYRHMCRYFSGFFYKHPLLLQYDYYWRIEPGVNFYCDLDYDPFVFMMENKKEYGFVTIFDEIPATIPTLWNTTKQYMKRDYPKFRQHRQLPLKSPVMRYVLNGSTTEIHDAYIQKLLVDGVDPDTEGRFVNVTWSTCHYWSNFEIGHFAFLRSPLYESYFNYLDKAGGFFYERWGDAPVHSLAAAMFLETSQIHHFSDIGYKHSGYSWCPKEEWAASKCYCDIMYRENMVNYPEWSCIKMHMARTKELGQ